MSASKTGSGSGFFNGLKSGASDFIGGVFSEESGEKIGRQVLPAWTAKAMDMQKKDQLNQTTFNPNTAPRRLRKPGSTTGQSTTQSPGFKTRNTLWDTYKGTNISGGVLIAGGIAAIAALVLVFK